MKNWYIIFLLKVNFIFGTIPFIQAIKSNKIATIFNLSCVFFTIYYNNLNKKIEKKELSKKFIPIYMKFLNSIGPV